MHTVCDKIPRLKGFSFGNYTAFSIKNNLQERFYIHVHLYFTSRYNTLTFTSCQLIKYSFLYFQSNIRVLHKILFLVHTLHEAPFSTSTLLFIVSMNIFSCFLTIHCQNLQYSSLWVWFLFHSLAIHSSFL